MLETRRIPDVCGLAPGARGFVASDGMGGVWMGDTAVARDDRSQWDNHLTAVVPAGPVGGSAA